MIFNQPLIAVCGGNEQKYYRFSLKATEGTQWSQSLFGVATEFQYTTNMFTGFVEIQN